MMELQRRPKDVPEHRYCVTKPIAMKVCRLCFRNVQSPMTSLCNKLILLFEFILKCFMAYIHIFVRVHNSRQNKEKLLAQREI